MDQWVSDPDGDDPAGMTYTITDKQVEGVSASTSGSTLSVSADAEAPKGQAGQLTIEVTDQQGASASASVPVNVIASSKPLVQTSPGQITLKAGESKTVDVSEYATNPLADQGPLTIMGDPATSAGGSATASGSTMTIQADAGFNGSFTVTYRVQDATKDVEREVQGTITATVLDKPGAPTGASAVSNSAGTALVSWRTGTTGGSPITSFTVTDHTQGDSKSCGAVAECLFDGRTNGTEHTFSVTATNEVGESDPSNKTSVLIDAKPETPGAPTVKPGDRSITVSWAAPVNTGSDLEGYDLELSPADVVVPPPGANETSLTISGLENGKEYKVRVRARNKNYTSEWSLYSQGVTPYGAPEAPTGVSATFSNGIAQVTWNKPSDTNGRNIEQYTVSATGADTVKVDAPSTSTSIKLKHSEQQVSISVKAVNDTKDPDAHTSPAATTTVWAVDEVNAPTIKSLKATGNSKEIAFKIEFQPDNGWSKSDVVDYQWTTDNWAHWDSLTRDGDHTVTSPALTDGVDATLQVKVTVRKSGTDKTSEAVVTGGTVSSFGPPAEPSVECRPGGPGWVNCSWSNADNGGRSASLVLTGAENKTIELTREGHREFNPGEGNSAQLCIKAVQTSSEKGTRESGQPCAKATAPVYARNSSGYQGEPGKCVNGPCGGGPFYKQGVELSGWPPNVAVRCEGTFAGKPTWMARQVDGNGYFRGVTEWNWGGSVEEYLVQGPHSNYTWFQCRQQ